LRPWIFLERIFLKNFSHTKNIFWIFPKTILPEIFPGTFTKYFSGTRDAHPVHDFPNCRIAPFAKIPASRPHLMQPTPDPSPYQPAPFFHPGKALACRDSMPEGVPGCDRPRVRLPPSGTSGTLYPFSGKSYETFRLCFVLIFWHCPNMAYFIIFINRSLLGIMHGSTKRINRSCLSESAM